jgi:hypothetical protein
VAIVYGCRNEPAGGSAEEYLSVLKSLRLRPSLAQRLHLRGVTSRRKEVIGMKAQTHIKAGAGKADIVDYAE